MKLFIKTDHILKLVIINYIHNNLKLFILVERIVEVPVERIVDRIVEVPRDYPVDRIVEVPVDRVK